MDRHVPVGTELTAAQAQLLENLLQISLRLSATRDLHELLERILTEARRLSSAQAGSLYVRRGDQLEFAVVQNDAVDVSGIARVLVGRSVGIGSGSLAGFAAASGRPVNIPDASRMDPEAPFRINRDFDAATGYHTRSILAIPLKRPEGQVVGALQLINCLDRNERVVPFPDEGGEPIMSLASMAAVSVHNALLGEELRLAHLETTIRLAVVAEFRDKNTADHIRRISRLSGLTARAMELAPEEVEMLESASPMHDIGKIGIPDSILLKPGPLIAEEREIMKTHTLIGAEMLSNPTSDLMRTACDIALCHHERWNGGGYPHNLKRGDIPLSARIVCLADVFDALATKRCYKDAYPIDKVIGIIEGERGGQFQPEVVDAFFTCLDEVVPGYRQG